MGETLKLAVPTMGAADLASERSGHFGHCDCFTIVDIEDGEIKGTSELANPPHEEGGCLRRWACSPMPAWTPSWRPAWACAR